MMLQQWPNKWNLTQNREKLMDEYRLTVQKAGEEEKERIKEKRAGPRKQKRKENSISSFAFTLLVIEDKSI
jgi:hypothetical protein